jgi:hypothetical protein
MLQPCPRTGRFLATLIPAVVGLVPSPARADEVSFRNQVMAVFSRAGCNQGTCHGNQNGKGGFKLSLRGEDPAFDYESLTREMLGRRTNTLRPEESLLLLKAVAAVPHEGGKRFATDSLEYAILKQWIAAGRPADPAGLAALRRIEVTPRSKVLVEPAEKIPLQVRAFFSDGSVRDVTRLAVYEPSNGVVSVRPDGIAEKQRAGETTILVRYLDQRQAVQLAFVPARPGFVWKDVPAANYVDTHIFAKLKTLRMLPSEICSDSVFVRRAYLDLHGRTPTADEVRTFLNDARSDKRARLIDALLERPEFADFWALKWSDVLRNEEKTLDKKGVQAFHHWIRQSIAANKPLNEFAREIIAARGDTYSVPAANFYRALREPQVRAEAAAQVFLGIRLQCARCHNHPFDQWTQNDYHSLAAFFARIDYRIIENNRKDRLDSHEFDGAQIVYLAREGETKNPRTGEIMRPRLLGDAKPQAAEGDRLAALADWIADPRNPFFARTQVNRVWHHLLGRGIVDPLDDFRASNPPVNGPLLAALAKDFAEHKFDLRHLIRTIMNSRTYQLVVLPNETNKDDETNFSHAQIRPLQAEQLLDSFSQVVGVPVKFTGYPLGLRAAQLPGVQAQRQRGEMPTPAEQFLKVFGKPERLLSCECERSDDTTLNQAFQLLTGELMNQMLAEKNNHIGQLLAAGKSNRVIIEHFYLAALGRFPSDRELSAAVTVVERSQNRRAGLEDVVWGLVNAKEFLLRR